MRRVLLLALVSCGAPQVRPNHEALGARIAATERSQRDGGILVLLAEDGRRLGDVTSRDARGRVLDLNAAWSPSGRFLVFASSRQRSLFDESSLWVARAVPDSELRRLTEGTAIDREPCFSPDGKGLVFVSNRSGGFDLWILHLSVSADGWPTAAGEPVRLTDSPSDERSPTWSPDGKTIAFMSVDQAAATSTLWTIPAAGGAPTRVTTGPTDGTPSWSPDGETIAFAARAEGERRGDADLYVVRADGTDRRRLIDEPLADETGPRYSSDGRFLFATAVLRARASGAPLLSSVVVVDLAEERPALRALHEAPVLPRLGPAIAPEPLSVEGLATLPHYDGAELQRALCGPGAVNRPEACDVSSSPVDPRGGAR